MEFKLDEKAIGEQFSESAQTVLAEIVEGYDFQSKVKNIVATSVLSEVFSKAVMDGVEQIDVDDLAQSMAKELARTAAQMVSMMLSEAAVEVVAKIRGVAEYSAEGKAERERIRAALRRGAR